MKVILRQDVRNLGQVGDVVTVKDGYARNKLLPTDMAYLATPANLKRIEKQKKLHAEQYAQRKEEALAQADKMAKASYTVSVEANEQEKLYGSISDADVVKALEAEGFSVDKKDIQIDQPIEELGIFEVGVILHPEVTAKIRLWVTRK